MKENEISFKIETLYKVVTTCADDYLKSIDYLAEHIYM